MRWEDSIPEEWISRDGRLWRDMSWAERQNEFASNPSLRRLLPKSFRQQRAARLRELRRLRSAGEILERSEYYALQDAQRKSASDAI